MADAGRLSQLAADLASELASTTSPGHPDIAWLQELRTSLQQDVAAAACAHPLDHLERFVSDIVSTLPDPFVIYGAGEVGRRLLTLCATQRRMPVAFVETVPPTTNATVHGLPVWTPPQARDAGVRGVVLGTLASAEPMRAHLANAYGATFTDLRCAAPVDVAGRVGPWSTDARLGDALDVMAGGRSLSEYLWLARHADERMDAAVPVNRTVRRIFHVDRYRFAGRFAASRRVLDCASGTGYGSGWLDRHAAPADVLGIEVDAEAVAYATRHYGSARVVFAQGDACRLEALDDRSRDLVVSFETIEHVADDDAMLRGFARLLDDAGVLVTSTPNDWPVETSPYHVRSYDPAGFERALRRWFDDVTLFAHVVPSETTRGGVVAWRGQSPTEAECLVAVCRQPRRAV